MNKDDSHTWDRTSHGLNKLVMDFSNKDDNEQETYEKQSEEYALKLNASAFASRSKAKAKPQRRDPASSSTRTIPIGKRTWTDVEAGEYSLSDYPLSKKLINLLRHGLPRETDGAIEFWRIKDYLQITAKSRPMMNLIARSSERAPSALSSTASECPGKNQMRKSKSSEYSS